MPAGCYAARPPIVPTRQRSPCTQGHTAAARWQQTGRRRCRPLPHCWSCRGPASRGGARQRRRRRPFPARERVPKRRSSRRLSHHGPFLRGRPCLRVPRPRARMPPTTAGQQQRACRRRRACCHRGRGTRRWALRRPRLASRCDEPTGARRRTPPRAPPRAPAPETQPAQTAWAWGGGRPQLARRRPRRRRRPCPHHPPPPSRRAVHVLLRRHIGADARRSIIRVGIH